MGKLTARAVETIKEPGRYMDGHGLMLVVKTSGAKSWILRIQVRGKRRDVGLGSVSDVSLSKARERAVETRKQFREGLDPIAARRASRRISEAPRTFRDEALGFHDERKATWKNLKHRAQWLSTMEAYVFPHIGDRPIEAVNGPEIRELMVPVWQQKAETARRVLQRIGAVLDFSHSRGLREQEAPLRSIRAGLGKQTRRVNHFKALPYARVSELFAKLRTSDTVGRLALRFVILTAARSGEVRHAVWSEIDFDNATWSVPAVRMKAQRDHLVPLSPQAISVLRIAEGLRVGKKPDAPVFPGARGGPLSDMTLTKALRNDLDGDFTVHGFRSSFRDWVDELTDFPDHAAEMALAHTIANKTEAAYRRADLLGIRRQMMSAWADYIDPAYPNFDRFTK